MCYRGEAQAFLDSRLITFCAVFCFFSRLCQQPTVHSCSVIFSSHLNVVDVHPYKLLQNHTNLFNSCFLFMMCPAPVF